MHKIKLHMQNAELILTIFFVIKQISHHSTQDEQQHCQMQISKWLVLVAVVCCVSGIIHTPQHVCYTMWRILTVISPFCEDCSSPQCDCHFRCLLVCVILRHVEKSWPLQVHVDMEVELKKVLQPPRGGDVI